MNSKDSTNSKDSNNQNSKIEWNLKREFQPAIPIDILISRKQELQNRLGQYGILVLYSAAEKLQSNTVYYQFRQDSDLYYLTGLELPSIRLIVTYDRMILFSDQPDSENEVWLGIRPNHTELKQLCPIDQVYSIDEFNKQLSDSLHGKLRLFYGFGQNTTNDAEILAKVDGQIRRGRAAQSAPSAIHHTHSILHQMRMIKSDYEIKQMIEIAKITAEAHRQIQSIVKPNLFEYQLEAEVLSVFKNHNSVAAYPTIVASGANSCILHYTSNHHQIGENDLILVDAGAAKHNIHTDVTRTFPASGKFNSAQKAAHNAVLQAQTAALQKTVIGSSMEESHLAAVSVLVDFLRDEKVLTESKDTCIEKQLYRPFYMHRTGHYIGYDVHDVGSYYDLTNTDSKTGEVHYSPREFEAGMVCTVEPGLYFSPGLEASKHFAGIGIRIEDDVLVTENEPQILTVNIPRSVEEIELFMKENQK